MTPDGQRESPRPAFSLAGKAAVVTGGSSGIGRAIVRRFMAAGANVLVADRRPPADDVPYVATDVSDEPSVAAMLAAGVAAFGRVDILVNNAGIQPLGVPFDDLTPELLGRTFAVNVHGVAFGVKHAARVLAEGGRIINTASFVGMIGVPGGTAYAASKATVIHLTRLAALELAPRRITVNAVSPGTIRTPAVTGIPDNPEIAFIEQRAPLRRLGEPDEVAATCQFLASDEAAYITGQNIAIDGGLTTGWTEYDLVPPANIVNGRWNDDR
ncbi:MAG TPA: SDR family oxidoreductase [Opitutaceae bacterium]|nr:SDR family oxidoreductase [Opitutaceae bacterium]